MNKYYYHGFESFYGYYGESIEKMLKLLCEGIITRNEVRKYNDERYNHVCLYRKNDDYDYSDKSVLLKSARSGWIDRCFVFVISPDIEAKKVDIRDTTGFDNEGNSFSDLIDEWRSVGDIIPSKIVGVAIPYNSIKKYLSDGFYSNLELEKDKEKVKKLLPMLEEYVLSQNLFIANSNIPNFTDELDSNLVKLKSKK